MSNEKVETISMAVEFEYEGFCQFCEQVRPCIVMRTPRHRKRVEVCKRCTADAAFDYRVMSEALAKMLGEHDEIVEQLKQQSGGP